ncbi:hypothetical protein F8M41_015176 [Gigaspora margarita]|uniref:Uncharacterized protein n=1 Tax=Gigaspora margarita TaxID=4874 RepID=A0A8H4AQW5_GIGMA|nr:hypothetical protein F8M41_015176 [Gigaspora margarita]
MKKAVKHETSSGMNEVGVAENDRNAYVERIVTQRGINKRSGDPSEQNNDVSLGVKFADEICSNGGNAGKVIGNTLGTGFSRLQCLIKEQRLKNRIILNYCGGMFTSIDAGEINFTNFTNSPTISPIVDSSWKLIKMCGAKMDVKKFGDSLSRDVYKSKLKGDLGRGQLNAKHVDGKMDV